MSSAAHGLTVYRPVGCVRCDYSGFSERVLVAEVLEGSGEFPEERCEVEIRDELKRLLGAGRITLEQFAAFGSDY
jgi:type II secretory ATPase GspE/PulE/Tfp pilus assembly ATPase PilB-like protein